MKSRLLLLVLLLPLFLTGINDFHDWGDDFAQYLLQAKNLTEGKPQTNTELVFSEHELPFAITAYPVGFPLILAPVFSVAGLHIPPYLYLNSLIILITALLFFDYLKKCFDVKLSIMIVLFYAYNIITLILKMEILSEFPYACLLLLILFLLRSQERKDFLWAAILSGFLVSVRASGMMILPAILFWQLFAKRQIPLQKKLLDSGIFLVLTLSVFLSLNCLLFDIDLKNFISFYSLQFESNRLMVPSNFFSFFEKIAAAFVPTFTSVLISIPVLAIIVTGFYKKIKEREAAEWFFIFYLLLTAVYPYSSSGLRFIYPVLPLILIYFAKGFQTIYHFIFSKDNSFAVLTIIFCSSIILSFKVLLSLPPADGPHAEDAQTVLNYIREKLPSNAIVLFSRARAINLYCERRSTFLIQHKNEKENLENLKNLNCEYILYPDERSGAFHQNLQDFLMINRNEFDTVFTADRYHLLRLKSVQ